MLVDSPLLNLPWCEWRNDHGTECPPFGIVRVTGMVSLEASRVVYTGSQPNTYGCQYAVGINGWCPTGAGKMGQILVGYGGCCALYDTADGTPAPGELWGPRSGGWKLKKNTPGFMVMLVTDATNGLVAVEHCPFLRFHGVTDAAIAKDASGTVSIFYGTGAGTDSTVNMASVYNSFGDVAISKDVECAWEGDLAGTSWKIVAAEC